VRALLLVTLALAACGGVAALDPAPCPESGPDASSPPDSDASTPPLPDASPDARDASLDVRDASDASDASCKPHLGHCLTHQATWCYETEGDEATESAKCNATGLSSGWHPGPCEDGARSNGGCQVGCSTEWRYPLGGGPSTLATRGFAKEACEVNQGGVYLPPTEPWCPLSIESLVPSEVWAGQAHNTLIVAKGCGFEGVRDVQVNVTSVPFEVLNNTTMVFLAALEPLDLDNLPLGEVDIIRVQPDQVQTFITYSHP